MATRGVPVRLVVWLFHLALPLLGLWLLLAVPSTDLLVEHHPRPLLAGGHRRGR